MLIVLGQVVGHTRKACVHIGTAQFFGTDNFACGGLHQRWATQKNRGLVFHDNGFIAHGGHVRTTGGTATHDHRNLRNALRAHIGLVEKNSSEVISVWKHFILIRQVGPARVDQVNTGQIVLCGHFLRTQMLFHAERVVGTTFHRGVVAHNHAVHATDPAYARNGARARRSTTVHAPGCQGCQFQKRGTGVKQTRHAFARQQFAACGVAFVGHFATALCHYRQIGFELVNQCFKCRLVGRKIGAAFHIIGVENSHVQKGPCTTQRRNCSMRSWPQKASPSTTK